MQAAIMMLWGAGAVITGIVLLREDLPGCPGVGDCAVTLGLDVAAAVLWPIYWFVVLASG